VQQRTGNGVRSTCDSERALAVMRRDQRTRAGGEAGVSRVQVPAGEAEFSRVFDMWSGTGSNCRPSAFQAGSPPAPKPSEAYRLSQVMRSLLPRSAWPVLRLVWRTTAELSRSWIKAAPAAPLARSVAGPCAAAPARRGRAHVGQTAAANQTWLIQSTGECCTEAVFLGLPLSSSRAPRLGRPPGVAARWLRQPRPGTHSHGSGTCEEDGDRAGFRLWRPGEKLNVAVVPGCGARRLGTSGSQDGG
jgi:hypothetical protein